MSDRERDFESMVEPPIFDRLRAFESVLDDEPCTNDGGCIILSNSNRMCSACRLRLRFFHIFYNAEAYEGGPGEIPRRAAHSHSRKDDE